MGLPVVLRALRARPALSVFCGGYDLRAAGPGVPVLLFVRPCGTNASFAAVANTCNLAELNTAALKVYNEDLVARDATTEAPTTAQTFEPTAAPESDAAGRMSPAVGAVAVALLALVA